MFLDYTRNLANRSIREAGEGDYYDEDGLLVCGVCVERKEAVITIGNNAITVGVACKCDRDKLSREEARFIRQQNEAKAEIMREHIPPECRRMTFDTDNRSNAEASDTCRKYVADWKDMLADNVGIILYGGVGGGKTFLASAVCNALIDKLVPCKLTTMPEILKGAFQDIDYDQFRVLVIDDFGAERATEWSVEQAYTVIDGRIKARLPLVITTNLSLGELRKPQSMAHFRVYDRIMRACPIRLYIDSPSQRAQETEAVRRALAERFSKGD